MKKIVESFSEFTTNNYIQQLNNEIDKIKNGVGFYDDLKILGKDDSYDLFTTFFQPFNDKYFIVEQISSDNIHQKYLDKLNKAMIFLISEVNGSGNVNVINTRVDNVNQILKESISVSNESITNLLKLELKYQHNLLIIMKANTNSTDLLDGVFIQYYSRLIEIIENIL